MKSGAILLVEDNPDDEALTLRALRKNNVANEVVVARDGAGILDAQLAGGRGQRLRAQLLERGEVEGTSARGRRFGALGRLWQVHQSGRFVGTVRVSASSRPVSVRPPG